MIDSDENRNIDPAQPGEISTKYTPGEFKLNSFNWLADIPSNGKEQELIEVRFKNTRKGFYRNVNSLRLEIGDIVAVEASPGHDIGIVSIVGRLVDLQMRQLRTLPSVEDLKKIYRKAKPVDIEKWEEAKALEAETMLKSRKIAEDLKLNMKIGDVEYQGDKTKAIFYYIADERVDFRQLIRSLADQFKVRIEMRQIGARQEAGRIGGIGSCGRELCCSSYMKNFISITTSHARYQELSLNPQKLAGQCSKLKCCLNYELDGYVDKQRDFPSKDIPLEIAEGKAYFMKMEVYKGIYWYSFDPNHMVNMTSVPVERVLEIQKLNKNGVKPDKLVEFDSFPKEKNDYENIVGQESLTRFETKKGNQGKRKNFRKKGRHDNRR